MLDLFLSRSILKKLKSFKNNFKKISIYTVVILAILGGIVTADFFICNSFLSGEATKINEDTKNQIEETEELVLSYEDKIAEAAFFYKSNYGNLSYNLKHNFELEFDELEIEIGRNSNEEIHILAQYKSYDDVEFILSENKLEKLEKEEPVVLYCVLTCIVLDVFILGLVVALYCVFVTEFI